MQLISISLPIHFYTHPCSIEKIKNAPINIKSLATLRIVHENFFLYDSKNMVVKTYVSELNRNISSYGVISFLGMQVNLEDKLHLITPEQKLKVNMKKNFYKNKVEFELGKVHVKKLFKTPQDNVLNFGILCTKKNK